MGTLAPKIVPPDAKRMVFAAKGRRIVVMDSIAFAGPEESGQIIVTGSHGGISAGEYATAVGCVACVCNDAGFGKNNAGIAGLTALDEVGMIGIGLSHSSARIGDGLDGWTSGVVSFANEAAQAAGIGVGRPLASSLKECLSGTTPLPEIHRASELRGGPRMTRVVAGQFRSRRVVILDSISFVRPEDRDQIIIAGSNGGHASGVVARQFACGFVALNDAGIGKDDAGVSGLRDMDTAGIPAVAVSHETAEISNGLDMWRNGVVSYVNAAAAQLGILTGEPLAVAIERAFGEDV